jgi:hypothetical protein
MVFHLITRMANNHDRIRGDGYLVVRIEDEDQKKLSPYSTHRDI